MKQPLASPPPKWLRPAYWVLLFTLLGFGLRVQRLGFQPLWGDEGWSFYFAGQPLPQLIALTAIDIHPPLYYLLLKFWLSLAGVGAEMARFGSVISGVLLIPVVAGLGRRWLGGRVGLIAAALTAMMPLAVYYAQEVRMYGLVTLLGAMSMLFFTRRAAGRGYWLAYVLCAAAAMYTMYYAAFLVLAQLLAALWEFRRAAQRSKIRTMLAPFAAIGLLYLPWLLYAAPRLLDYIRHKRAVEGYLPLDPLTFLADHLAVFSLGHLPEALRPWLWAALPAVLAMGLGLWAIRRQRRAALLYFYVGTPLLAGFLDNRLFPFTPPNFERTLLLAAPACWLLLAAGLVWLAERRRWLAGLLALLVLLPIAISLLTYFSISRYPEEDYRPLLRQVAAIATPEDTILASYQWQVGFYQAYLPPPRPHIFAVPEWGAGWSAQAGHAAERAAALTALLAQSPRLWFPAYQAGGHIWEDETETDLAALGYPALRQWYSPQTKLILTGGTPSTPLQPIAPANFAGQLRLGSGAVGMGSFEAGRGIVPVELRWQSIEPMDSEHQVSLRLVDAAGRTWTTRDSLPQAGQRSFIEMKPGDELADRHGLLLPAGAPPGPYRLLLSVRRVSDAHPLDVVDEAGQPLGAELPLAEITLVPPQPPTGPAALPIQIPLAAAFGPQVRLLGYSLGDGPFKAGESLPLTLFWQALAEAPAAVSVRLELQDGAGQTVVSQTQPPLWPAPQWRAGDTLRDPQPLLLPPDLPPGQYRLTLALLDAAGQAVPTNHKDYLPLQTIATIDRPRVFAPPAPGLKLGADFGGKAQLVGLDLPLTTVKPGQNLPLTLYWRATARFDKNWTVFVHLTDSQGQIIGQQDQPPGGGQFPTLGWLPGEYLTDSYNLSISPDAPIGQPPNLLSVGLYDPHDFSRLPVLANGQVIGDHVMLDSWPISIE